ncbi:peroxisomal targeting signal 1 receptor-like isoform X2 [Varroa destructor]|uniref:Peroxisomal targeting signal 1 receptor n=1 Tax=Varroa destructor TaxID=109461 RepID=A0A7M7KYE1_VARDE|nr:peroxisomal targeting signal 1 receptor-like isoform X2 [Varroa destructor]
MNLCAPRTRAIVMASRTTSRGQQWVREFGTVDPSSQARSWATEFMISEPRTASSSAAAASLRVASVLRDPHMTPQLYGPERPILMPIKQLMPAALRPEETGAGGKWAEDILAESEQKNADELLKLQKVARDFVRTENDPSVEKTEFYKFVQQVGGESSAATAERWAKELDQEERSMEKTAARDDFKMWKDLAEIWGNASFNTMGSNGAQGNESLPESYRNYRFNEQNFLEDAVQNPFEEGLQKLREGDLPSAVLLFEAAVRKDSAHAEAWQLLGTTQAQNEQDIQAIAALRQCLHLQPQNAAAMLALAVSYTNEGLQRQACEVLTEWLRASPKYGHLVQPVSQPTGPQTSEPHIMSVLEDREHKRVLDMYISAAQINPDSPDPDIQSCLGVLLSLTGDFDKAVDCFRAAVAVKPEDSLLWNRLGATLANGGRSEEAVEAYRQSLQLHPGFIRARFNLGISCINLGAHQEAAEHFLTALNLQDNAKAEAANGIVRSRAMSDNIWNTLRMTLTLMNRTDLYPDVDARDLSKLNRIFIKQDTPILS